MTFGERLRKARLQKNMSQQQLAQQIYTHKETISGYERGRRQPSIDTIARLSDVLEVSCDYLIKGERK